MWEYINHQNQQTRSEKSQVQGHQFADIIEDTHLVCISQIKSYEISKLNLRAPYGTYVHSFKSKTRKNNPDNLQ